jgi:peptidoglycan lytic transglycosylase G
MALLGSFLWWKQVQNPIDLNNEEQILVVIPKGAGVITIGEILKDKQLIKSPLAFRLLVKIKNYDTKLQAGSFHLSQSQGLSSISQSLTQGREDFWITIPEGKRREEIALLFFQEFSQQNLSFSIPDFLDTSADLEGYLFPDTYLIPKTMDEIGVVNLLRSTFDQKLPDEKKVAASNLGLSFSDVLILASLVEREAKHEVDRPKVAGVLLNRLDIGMALQIDATVQYGVGQANCLAKVEQKCDWWPVLTNTKFNSSYNTYQHPNLPPGPICSPGLASIEAVLDFDSHDYLYYLSEPSGKTHYSKTLEEHQTNIAKYLN